MINLGNTVTPFTWSVCEGPVSIISVSLPNIVYLVQRVRKQGLKGLFTRRVYASGSAGDSEPAPHRARPHVASRGFERIKDNSMKLHHPAKSLVTRDDQCSASASASANHGMQAQEAVEMSRVHVRIDVDVSEDYTGSPV